MNFYSIAKLIHIVGALGFFIALGVEWLSLWSARHAATAEQVRERLYSSTNMRRLGPISMLAILLSGFSMMAVARMDAAWLIVAFWTLVLMVVIALALTAPRVAAIGRALANEHGPLSASLHSLLHDARLWLSMRLRVSLALGIIFLMTLKPDLVGSLITVGVAVIVGLATSLPMKGRDPENVQA